MSRSKHTDPPSVRAGRRIRAPFKRRRAGDLSLRRVSEPTIIGLDHEVAGNDNKGFHPASRPRIIWRQPRPGFHHAITKRDVLELLEAIGPIAVYGLRSIEFARVPASNRATSLVFGRYKVPGRILLFEQAFPPWRLHGRLAKKDVERFEQAGARVCQMPQSVVTSVDWPAGALRRFMLEQVLLHELGHHVLQHHKGKRLARIARTRDHEAFAALFATRQLQVLPNQNPSTR
jgi:hypothetical protein